MIYCTQKLACCIRKIRGGGNTVVYQIFLIIINQKENDEKMLEYLQTEIASPFPTPRSPRHALKRHDTTSLLKPSRSYSPILNPLSHSTAAEGALHPVGFFVGEG